MSQTGASAFKQYYHPKCPINFGYCCNNMALREQKPSIYTARTCIQKTFKEKGLKYISELALANVKDILPILEWNLEHEIYFFRLSSAIFPWCSEYKLTDLKDYDEIKEVLKVTGDYVKKQKMRITCHPDHFIKLASKNPILLKKSIHELEIASEIFDLMGFKPSLWNKVNIHIGSINEGKVESMDRFADVYHNKLTKNLQKRLTVENDDTPNAYSVKDLLYLYKLTGIPIVFDFHHHKFCSGGLSHKEALELVIATWPQNIRPVVHWSESQAGRKPLAHSDMITKGYDLYGYERNLDCQLEAKYKERALLHLRDLYLKDKIKIIK